MSLSDLPKPERRPASIHLWPVSVGEVLPVMGPVVGYFLCHGIGVKAPAVGREALGTPG